MHRVDWLLARGADINGGGWLGGRAKGPAARHIAASNGRAELVRRLPAEDAKAALRNGLCHGARQGRVEFHRQLSSAALLR